jgi:chromosome segregation ATPase
MKKGIALILALIITIVVPVTAFAATPVMDKRMENLEKKLENIENQKAQMEQKRQKFADKRAEYAKFRAALKEKHDICFSNRKENVELIKENARLSQELRASLKAIKEKGIVLDEETLTKLNALKEELKSLKDALKDTKGDIKAAMEEYKGFVKNKDYASMELVFEKIKAIQEFRTEQLTEIGNTLKEMITLIVAVA